MGLQNLTLNIAVTGLTPEKLTALVKSLQGIQSEIEETSTTDITALKAKSKKTTPETTVSDDEDEDFGTKTLKSKDLEDDEEDLDDEEVEEDDSDDEDDAPEVDFKTLRNAVNTYGEKKPDQMKAILLTFNMKSPKELSAKHNERHWDAVYLKVKAKLKALKKK